MVKRILAGTIGALILVGCGGSGSSGTAFVYGVNADPNVGGVTITANGTPVLSNAGFATSSSSFVTVSSGANAQVFATNSTGGQLAGTTFAAGFLGGQYYSVYAYNSSAGALAILPVDVTQPPAGVGRVMFTNTSVFAPSVDAYVTTQTVPTGLVPNASGVGVFNSGFASEVNNIPPGTYNVIFTQSGTQNIVATASGVAVATVTTGAGENVINVVGITDAPGTTTPALQQALTPIIYLPVTGATAPSFAARPIIINGSKVKN